MTLDLNTGKFKLIGGGTSLDFVNTVFGWNAAPDKVGEQDYHYRFRADKINSYADLIAWSLKTKLIDEKQAKKLLQLAAQNLREAEKVLKRAVVLRESIYHLFKSAIENWQPESSDLDKLDKELTVARQHQKFSGTKKGFGFQWIDVENRLDSMLWQISQAAAEILTTGDLSRIRQCGGNDCGWMFLDASRNRSRQWCDMKDCGNLAKVRRFRQQRKAVSKDKIPEK